MYEHTPAGLGWETIFETNWLGGQTETPHHCMELVDRGVPGAEAQQRCFKETTAERQLATEAQCVRIGWPCETSGAAGSTWCCPPGQPDRQVPEGQVIPGDPAVTIIPPSGGDPRPVFQHSFLSRLSHPGAMMAIGLFGVVAYLGYRSLVATEDRHFADV